LISFYSCYNVVSRFPHLFSLPTKTELLLSLGFTILITSLRFLLSYFLLKSLGDNLLSLNKWKEPKEKKFRIERFAAVVFKFVYFSCITIWGFYLLSSREWFPTFLGGEGDIKKCYEDYPNQVIPEEIRIYFLFQLAYHCHSLIFQFILPHRNDFMEMVLHHNCAIFLLLFSYFMNFVRIGTIVLFIHDVGDILTYATKALVDTQYVKLAVVVYFILMAFWLYLRLYIFPFYIIYSTITQTPEFVLQNLFFSYFFLNILLVLLFVLHVYWFFLLIAMFCGFSKTGEAKDFNAENSNNKIIK